MGFRTTLWLLVLVGGLTGALLLLDDKPGEDGAVAIPLLEGRLSSAVKIRWQLRDRMPIEVQRLETGFFLTEPERDLASLSVLRSIGDKYDSANLAETPIEDTPEERKQLGFDPPRATFEVEFQDGTKDKFILGDDGPLGQDLYVLREDDQGRSKIYSGSKALYSAILHNSADLRERMVFRTMAQVARTVRIDQRNDAGRRELLELSKASGKWRLVKPIEAVADGDVAQQFVQILLGLRADEFAPGFIRRPERDPDIVLEIEGGFEPEKVEAWFDEQQNLLIYLVKRGIWVKSYNRTYLNALASPVDALRARVLVETEGPAYESILAIIVDFGEEQPRLRVVRGSREEPWRLAEPVDAKANPTAVNELLTAVNNLRALEFYEGSSEVERFGLAGNGLRLGYQTGRSRGPKFIRLGSTGTIGENEIVYAARTDALEEVVGVPKGAVDVIRRDWQKYVERDILKVREQPSRVQLQRLDGSSRTIARDDQGEWRIDGGEIHELAADIVDRMRDLRGKRTLLRREAKLGDPDWSVGIGRSKDPAGQHLVSLQVWERGELPLLVIGPGNPDLVFELSVLDSDAMRRLWK